MDKASLEVPVTRLRGRSGGRIPDVTLSYVAWTGKVTTVGKCTVTISREQGFLYADDGDSVINSQGLHDGGYG